MFSDVLLENRSLTNIFKLSKYHKKSRMPKVAKLQGHFVKCHHLIWQVCEARQPHVSAIAAFTTLAFVGTLQRGAGIATHAMKQMTGKVRGKNSRQGLARKSSKGSGSSLSVIKMTICFKILRVPVDYDDVKVN
jgi:hypothetical protein